MRVRRHSGSMTGRGQDGAALLVFMLVLLVGSSYMLISRLNEFAQTYARDEQTRAALLKAKKALLNYAMNYPELKGTSTVRGPGYLPCPDENDDGTQETNCSVTTGSTLGRLPTQTLGLGDLRDSSGERLWYAVSQNFKYNQPKDYVLNSETPGTISVDGSGDIVAVVMAPGAPLTGQTDRQPTPETAWLASNGLDLYQVAGEYLEDDNATTGDASYVTSSSSGNEFNDQLVTITRAELMQYVQKRVLAEARDALASYRDSTGAYPWLAPFGDPKADARWVRGYASSTGTGDLIDSSADFSAWGINSGDVIWNITQGAVGQVSGTPSSNDVPASGMSFNTNDEYLIEPSGLAAVLSDGTADSASSGTTLEDTSKDFDAPLVAPGDIVDDATDGSSGRVESVANDTLTVVNLRGGTNNAFTPGDSYRVRSNAGTATPGSSGTTLVDAVADFQTRNVQAGALVRDLTDGSFGQVADISGVHKLTVTSLNMGTNNSFSSGDHYVISRYDPVNNTTEGMLPIQEPGQAFPTGFNMDWALSSSSYVDVMSGLDTTYSSSITSLVQSSANNASTLSVSSTDGRCIWVDATIADCRGFISDPNFLSGTVTGQSGSYLTDSSQNFSSMGIKRGDKVVNTSDSTEGIVRSVYSSTVLRISNIYGSSLNYAPGQPYRVYTASRYISGHATSPTWPNIYVLYARGADFSTVKVGDVIENTTWNAIGEVTGVNAAASPPYVTFTPLQDGTYPDFYPGEAYTIHTQYVDKRVYEFQVRMKGTAQSASSSGVRTRSVCIGYDSSCTSTSGTVTFPINTIAPQISLLDYDSSGNLVGSATAPKTGTSPTGNLRISGISYPLTAGDFPEWFVKNRWQQLLYAAYSSLYEPGGAGGNCTVGTNCLQVSVQTPPATLDSEQSLILAAGKQLDSQVEDRTSGRLDAYFESGNASSGDRDFDSKEITSAFNDQVQIICPDRLPRPKYTCP